MVSDTVCSGLQHAMLHQPSESATNRVLIDFVQLCCVLCDVCTVGAVHWRPGEHCPVAWDFSKPNIKHALAGDQDRPSMTSIRSPPRKRARACAALSCGCGGGSGAAGAPARGGVPPRAPLLVRLNE